MIAQTRPAKHLAGSSNLRGADRVAPASGVGIGIVALAAVVLVAVGTQPLVTMSPGFNTP